MTIKSRLLLFKKMMRHPVLTAQYTKARFVPEHFDRPDSYRELSMGEIKHIDIISTCPYCHGDLYEGPTGGASINLLCVAPECWARFNVAYFAGQAVLGQYVGQDKSLADSMKGNRQCVSM
jgi:hypothetical protein